MSTRPGREERLRRVHDARAGCGIAALVCTRNLNVLLVSGFWPVTGNAAADVDRAARTVLTRVGFGQGFVHPLGHDVGFSAIDHHEPPRIHPASHEVLEEGMVFNVEQGGYIDGYVGVRDCNMVAVTADGCELLSPLQQQPGDWSIHV
jgi:hypothetical protein